MMERCDASFALSVVRGGGPDWERAGRERMTGPDVLLPPSSRRGPLQRCCLIWARVQRTAIWPPPRHAADLISQAVFMGKKRELN